MIELDEINQKLADYYKKLNKRKLSFLEAYLKSGSIAQAVRDSDSYSSRSCAHRMMTNDDNIQNIISLEQMRMFHRDSSRPLTIVNSLRGLQEECLKNKDYKTFLRSIEIESKIRGFLGRVGTSEIIGNSSRATEEKCQINMDSLNDDELEFFKGYAEKLQSAELTVVKYKDLFSSQEQRRFETLKEKCYVVAKV